jgi:hypothetical protein
MVPVGLRAALLPVGIGRLIPAAPVPAMPAVPEDMEERAREQQQKREVGHDSDEMCAVLGDQEICRDRKEREEHQTESPLSGVAVPVAASARVVLMIVIHRFAPEDSSFPGRHGRFSRGGVPW